MGHENIFELETGLSPGGIFSDRRFFLNLIRSNLVAENSVNSWSIFKGGAHISNLDRMGTLILP